MICIKKKNQHEVKNSSFVTYIFRNKIVNIALNNVVFIQNITESEMFLKMESLTKRIDYRVPQHFLVEFAMNTVN